MIHTRWSLLLCTVLLVGVHAQAPMVDADSLAKDENYLLQPPTQLKAVKAREIAAGGYQSAYISDDGELYYWGLVAGKVLNTPTRATWPPSSDSAQHTHLNITTISLGGYHLMALDAQGRLYTWGRGAHGALGHGSDISDKENPTLVSALSKRKVKLIAAGYAHSVAVTDAGVYVWGSGNRGQLGIGASKDIDTPKLLKVKGISLKHVTDVCAGGYHTALLTDDGEVYAFGANDYGNLGLGNKKDTLSPTRIGDLSGVIDISCGGDHMLALTKDNKLYSWGWGEKGQLGVGTTEDHLLPHEVDISKYLRESEEFPTSISAGGYATSFVVTNLGRVFAFGWGEYGMLGNQAQENLLFPTELTTVSDVKKVDGGGYKHTILLTQSRDVFVFGENTFGQLGLTEDEDIFHMNQHQQNDNNILLPMNSKTTLPP